MLNFQFIARKTFKVSFWMSKTLQKLKVLLNFLLKQNAVVLTPSMSMLCFYNVFL